MIEENQELNLETDHLEEVIDSPPPGQPVVVIQYRTRGVPWYLVLPLLVLVPLGAVAVYHRVSSRARCALGPPQSADLSTRKTAAEAAVTEPLSNVSANAASQALPPASIADLGSPLALNSQPIAPGSLPAVLPQPGLASPAATTKVEATSKTAGSTDLANTQPDVKVADTPPPLATIEEQPEPRVRRPPLPWTRLVPPLEGQWRSAFRCRPPTTTPSPSSPSPRVRRDRRLSRSRRLPATGPRRRAIRHRTFSRNRPRNSFVRTSRPRRPRKRLS